MSLGCNTFCYILSYLIRCNSDVTSLLSGTSIKAVIAYVTDYITKTPLKSHVMFDIIQRVLDRNTKVINKDGSSSEKARKLMVQITNAFMSHLELGTLFAATYLLGLPDHYINFQFKVCYWQSYVNQVEKVWRNYEEGEDCGDILDAATVLIVTFSDLQTSFLWLSPKCPSTHEDTFHKLFLLFFILSYHPTLLIFYLIS